MSRLCMQTIEVRQYEQMNKLLGAELGGARPIPRVV